MRRVSPPPTRVVATAKTARTARAPAPPPRVEALVQRVCVTALASFVVASSRALDDARAATPTRFAGDYADPNHPGCPRAIDARGNVSGLDPVPFARGRGCRGVKKSDQRKAASKFNAWTIKGKINKADDEILIDFDQKDGSGERVVGKLTPKGDVALPDGTIWRRKSDAEAWTPR